MKRSMRVPAAGLLAMSLFLGACSSGDGEADEETAAPAASGEDSLAGVCPDPVVIQTDWNPEAEHGGTYEFIDPEVGLPAGG